MVYANYNAEGLLRSVEVVFLNDNHVDWDNDEDDYFE